MAIRFLIAVIAMAILTIASCRRDSVPRTVPSASDGHAIALSEQLPPPPPRDQTWVGSQVCAECHQEIAQQYARHPMANSCMPAVESNLRGEATGEFSAADNRKYRSEITADNRMIHHESLSDDQGTIYDLAVEVNYVIGSGRRGRSYVAQQNGILVQSPLTWYSQENRWDLSPGYSPESHQRFERQIGDGCLYCHAGRPSHIEAEQGNYATPAFKEYSIGCERCHGPAESHVAHHREGKEGADPIVNPSKLDPARREATCNICHLQGRVAFRRFGRDFFDFRPGDRLEDVLLIYVEGERIEEEQTLPVSQVEQMRSSRCFQASLGKMGCISCHDPHHFPDAASKTDYYRTKCLSCHAAGDCSAPTETRQADAVQDSCAHCHMPPLPTVGVAHTSLTDHRVLIRPSPGKSSKKANDPFALQLFDVQNAEIPERELDRGRGLVLMEAAGALRTPDFAFKAQQYLVPEKLRSFPVIHWLTALANDPEVLDALGTGWQMLDRTDLAMQFWEAAFQAGSGTTASHLLLARAYEQRGDLSGAIQTLEVVSRRNPFAAEPLSERARLLTQQGRLVEAIAAAKKGLDCDPTRTALRKLLSDLYRKTGDAQAAAREEEISERIQAALQKN